MKDEEDTYDLEAKDDNQNLPLPKSIYHNTSTFFNLGINNTNLNT